MTRAGAVRALVPALVALALVTHHGGPPSTAAGHHGADGCPACAHGPEGAGLLAACLGIVAAALALPGLAAALRPRWPAPGRIGTPRVRGWCAARPPARGPPRPPGVADLCVLRR